jgi:hypothetical protein
MRKLVLAVAAVCFGLIGCVTEPAHADPVTPVVVVQEVVVPAAPPVEVVEVVPVAPGPRWVWTRGYWSWTGYRYVWVRGRYVVGVPGRVWVPHRYYYRRGVWVHVRGHWC